MRSFFGVVVFGLDIDNFLEVGLVEVLAGVLEYVLWLLLEDLVEEDRDHVLEFGVLAEVDLVIDPVLYFLLVEEPDLGGGDALDAGNVVGIVVLLLVVHVAYLVVVYVLLLRHFSYLFDFDYIPIIPIASPRTENITHSSEKNSNSSTWKCY